MGELFDFNKIQDLFKTGKLTMYEEVLKNENMEFTLLPKPFTRRQLLLAVETIISNE